MSHFDASLLVFLIAAAIAHRRVSQEKPEHSGIFWALVAVVLANIGSIALYPNRGLIPILCSLSVPGACLYGACVTHGFRARLPIIVTLIFASVVFVCSLVEPGLYTWTILGSWSTIAMVAWVCLLDPDRQSTGITRLSAVALAASLLADLPGVYVWASHGTWRAESVITSLSVVILATLPVLWKLTCKRSLSARSYLESASSLEDEREEHPQMRSE